MASQVEICNYALSVLGAGAITSLSDSSESARVMTRFWDMARQSELRKHFWSFALKRDTLPALSTAPAWGFDTGFQLPSDYLRLIQINDTFAVPAQTDYRTQDDSAWVIESGVVMCNFGAPLKIRYVRDVTDPASFDPLFAEALGCRLAYLGCEKLTNSTSKQQVAQGRYTEAVRDAVRANAIERPPAGQMDDSWMVARL